MERAGGAPRARAAREAGSWVAPKAPVERARQGVAVRRRRAGKNMGFLDNSGDIILDAVLTDTGRFRLAKGDGSFRIVKFALVVQRL